jgi:hypothetical protein
VRTTVHAGAEVREGGELAAGSASVLRYSRVGEPPNACGSGAQYVETLWIQVPSIAPGQAYALGGPGVTAVYEREQGGATIRAQRVTGKVTIKKQRDRGVAVAVAVTVALPSGEVVKLDDDYDFHPAEGGR